MAFLARFAPERAALVSAQSSWEVENPEIIKSNFKVEWSVSDARTIEFGTRDRSISQVLVQVRGGGQKTKIVQCDAKSTMGALREQLGVPFNEVILLLPRRRELDDEMRVGQIVREGPMTVEVRCRGVGGGLLSWLFKDQGLGEAAGDGDIDKVRRLLAAGADANANKAGITALHGSAYSGHVEVSQMLLRAGADVNSADSVGQTPLHYSADNGHEEVCQMLVGAGANLHTTNNRGQTALHCSAIKGHVEVGQVLVDAGVNVNAMDTAARREYVGYTPLHLSAANGHVEMSRMLVGGQRPRYERRGDHTATSVSTKRPSGGEPDAGRGGGQRQLCGHIGEHTTTWVSFQQPRGGVSGAD